MAQARGASCLGAAGDRLRPPRVKQLLTPNSQEHIEVFDVKFEIGGSTGDGQYTHGDSDEFLLVQSGSLKLELSRDVFLLEAGDSIVFRSSVPHRVVNVGPEASTVLWVIRRPASRRVHQVMSAASSPHEAGARRSKYARHGE